MQRGSVGNSVSESVQNQVRRLECIRIIVNQVRTGRCRCSNLRTQLYLSDSVGTPLTMTCRDAFTKNNNQVRLIWYYYDRNRRLRIVLYASNGVLAFNNMSIWDSEIDPVRLSRIYMRYWGFVEKPIMNTQVR